MKKIIVLGIAVIVLISTLWFSAGSATAAGTITYRESHFVWGKGVVFIFDATGYKNSDVKGATLTIGSSTFDVHCTVNKKAGKIICVAGSGLTQYAGQIGILTLAGHAFYVKIPDRSVPPPSVNGNPSLCPPGTESGAMVSFFTSDETIETHFVSGSTLAQVQSNAENMLNDFLRGIEGIGDLSCSNDVPN